MQELCGHDRACQQPTLHKKSKAPPAALRGLLAAWQVRWERASQHTSSERWSLRGIKGLSRHILAMKPAAVFHDPLTPLRLRFAFHRPTVSPGRLFDLVKPWGTSEARQALSTANEVCVSAPLPCFGGGGDWAFVLLIFQKARLVVSPKRAKPDHEQTAKCALTGCTNPARPSGYFTRREMDQ